MWRASLGQLLYCLLRTHHKDKTRCLHTLLSLRRNIWSDFRLEMRAGGVALKTLTALRHSCNKIEIPTASTALKCTNAETMHAEEKTREQYGVLT